MVKRKLALLTLWLPFVLTASSLSVDVIDSRNGSSLGRKG